MIDDLQDDYLNYSENNGSKKKRFSKPLAMFLLVFVIWVVFAAIYAIVYLPKIKTALEVTNAVEIVQNLDDYKTKGDKVKVKVFFVNPSESNPVLVESTLEVESTGSTLFHDSIEGLLNGPSNQALLNGSISFINSNTRLLGITQSNSVVFIDLSKEFLNSASDWGSEGLDIAKAQVIYTLKNVDPTISKVITLVEGSQI